jgi:hypothetical protein
VCQRNVINNRAADWRQQADAFIDGFSADSRQYSEMTRAAAKNRHSPLAPGQVHPTARS